MLPAFAGVRSGREGSVDWFDVLRQPDLLRVELGQEPKLVAMTRTGGRWTAPGAEVTLGESAHELTVLLAAPTAPVHRVHLRWFGRLPEGALVMGDAWERSYGELAWLPLRADRVLPWYCLCASGGAVHGVGVKTGAAALAFWQVDAEGVSLWLDVRNGGDGVTLGERMLRLASVVQQRSGKDGSPWQTVVALCRAMAAGEMVVPRRGAYSLDTVYGSNDWYYAYGKNTAAGILRDADLMRELAPAAGPMPFCIVDDGYQDAVRFPSMPRLAEEIRGRGAAPGLWIRPLRASRSDAGRLLVPQAHWVDAAETEPVYDPTVPEAMDRVLRVVREACDWGYDFIKHDFTTYELLGQWGSSMGASPTRPGWSFADRSRTNAEILRELYRRIRATAGPDRVILGCNTVGHLSVGLFDASRTGDDVSGRTWERTRRLGVNTLAFRLPQNRIFFATDADCVPITPDVSWRHTEQWLRAVAESGSVLLVSPDPKAIGPAQKAAIRDAFATAAAAKRMEPMDWMESAAPERWKVAGREETFAWLDAAGASPFAI